MMRTRLHVLILQHPSEKKEPLNSATLAHSLLADSTLTIGLSWPNLKQALKRGHRAEGVAPPNEDEVSASQWATLYLGTKIQLPEGLTRPGLYFVSQKGNVHPPERQAEIRSELRGIILLDGTWPQVKSMWWKNAWLLKTRRAVLIPSAPSLYGKLRKEPRKECVSTLETIAETLTALGEPTNIASKLRGEFGVMLKNAGTSKP